MVPRASARAFKMEVSMNKTKAKREAQHNVRPWSAYKALLGKADRSGMSRVNPIIPMAKAIEVYEAAIAGRADDEVPAGLKEDVYRPGRWNMTGDALIMHNILRDTGGFQ
jgi:hypothetical protein